LDAYDPFIDKMIENYRMNAIREGKKVTQEILDHKRKLVVQKMSYKNLHHYCGKIDIVNVYNFPK